MTEFPVNMARYASEVQQFGGVPVMVTPLTRRSFNGAYLKDDLAPWSQATRKIAQARKVTLLDLNTLSADAVQKMGQQEADTLAMEPPRQAAVTGAGAEPQGTPKSAFDRTHLGPKGADLFSAMVAHELVRLIPAVAASLR